MYQTPFLLLLLVKLALSLPPKEGGEDGHTVALPGAPASARDGLVHC